MQAPGCPEDQKVSGLRMVTCMRFSTPFYSEDGLDERQKQLEAWGVNVTECFDEAVADCDAVMLEINDPAYHLEYFEKCAQLQKPVFLDKPMADTWENGKRIYNIAAENNVRVFSSSALRFVPQLKAACGKVSDPVNAYAYGPLGKAAAGSSIVWYGVHAFEMLQRAMGRGALSVFTKTDPVGAVALVKYPGRKRGIVELTEGAYLYGGCLRTGSQAAPFTVDFSRGYSDLLIEVRKFFEGAQPPLTLDDTLEVMALLDAAETSFRSGNEEVIKR